MAKWNVNVIARAVWVVLLASQGTAFAADNAPKLVRVVVPFAPAGGTDAVSRKFAQNLGTRTGQSVIIENRPGAGGALGTEWVIKATPDGSTLLFHSAALITDALLKSSPTYDVKKDLAPVTTIVTLPMGLMVSNPLPAKNTAELVSLLKQSPNKLNYGTPGLGSSLHLATELFLAISGAQATHVPYKGGGPAATALLAGETDFSFLTITTSKPLALSGKARILGVSTKARAGFWPEIPSISESGVPSFDMGIWFGLLAPVKTPANVLETLNGHSVAILKTQEMLDWGRANGMEMVGDSREDFARRISKDIDQWSALIRKANIRAE